MKFRKILLKCSLLYVMLLPTRGGAQEVDFPTTVETNVSYLRKSKTRIDLLVDGSQLESLSQFNHLLCEALECGKQNTTSIDWSSISAVKSILSQVGIDNKEFALTLTSAESFRETLGTDQMDLLVAAINNAVDEKRQFMTFYYWQ